MKSKLQLNQIFECGFGAKMVVARPKTDKTPSKMGPVGPFSTSGGRWQSRAKSIGITSANDRHRGIINEPCSRHAHEFFTCSQVTAGCNQPMDRDQAPWTSGPVRACGQIRTVASTDRATEYGKCRSQICFLF